MGLSGGKGILGAHSAHVISSVPSCRCLLAVERMDLIHSMHPIHSMHSIHPIHPLADGSWSQTCSPMSWRGGVLMAYCGLTHSNGSLMLAHLNLTARCPSGTAAASQYGSLYCQGQAVVLPGEWVGGRESECMKK